MATEEPAHEKAKGTAALSKGIRILNTIAESAAPIGARELSERTALPRPTVYRLIAALSEAGLVRAVAKGSGYRLGPTLVTIAHRALEQTGLSEIAQEHLLTLRDETGETVHLAVFNDGAMLYVNNVDSRERVRMSCSLGAQVPLHTTAVGKAYLAFLPEAERAALLDDLAMIRVTGASITSRRALRGELDDIRRRGWSTDAEENERDIFCFGAPVLNSLDRPVAALSISIPRYRLKNDVETSYVAPLLRTARIISTVLGYRPPAPF